MNMDKFTGGIIYKQAITYLGKSCTNNSSPLNFT